MTWSQGSRGAARIRSHVAWCLLPQALFVLLGVGASMGKLWVSLPAVFLVALIPAADKLTGWQDDGSFAPEDFSVAQRAILHWNIRGYAILLMASVLFVTFFVRRFTATEVGLLLASCSLMSGIGFAAAHELLHGKSRLDQVLQGVLTTFLFYPHYKLIHIYSHHVHASTPEDKNTAWRDESVYRYFRRTVPGSLKRCWELEQRRLHRMGDCALARWLQNRMLARAAAQVVLLAALYGGIGFHGLVFYVGHIVGAHLVLESVNYIQHYALLREKRSSMTGYEATGPQHSWDTYNFFSSYVTFRVGHHAQHHLVARPYYLLGPVAESPKLGFGYFCAIPMVLLPPVWRAVMEPRLTALEQEARPATR